MEKESPVWVNPKLDGKVKEEDLIVCNATEVTPVSGKRLVLGSHITKPSIDAGFYYMGIGEGNAFWLLLSAVTGDRQFEQKFKEYNERYSKEKNKNDPKLVSLRNSLKGLLEKHNIGIADVCGRCECVGSKDSQIVRAWKNDFNYQNLQEKIDKADVILFNGKSKNAPGPSFFFNYFNFSAGKKKLKWLISSSGSALGGRKRITAKDRENQWKEAFGE